MISDNFFIVCKNKQFGEKATISLFYLKPSGKVLLLPACKIVQPQIFKPSNAPVTRTKRQKQK